MVCRQGLIVRRSELTNPQCPAAHPRTPLKSATISLIRRTASAGSGRASMRERTDWAAISDLAGRSEFCRRGRNARSRTDGARRSTRPGQAIWIIDRGRWHFVCGRTRRGGRISGPERRRQIDRHEDHQRLPGADLRAGLDRRPRQPYRSDRGAAQARLPAGGRARLCRHDGRGVPRHSSPPCTA